MFYCFKTSGDLCWFEMGCYNTELSIMYGKMYTIQSRRPKTKNFENRTYINSTKILKQLLSLLNNILNFHKNSLKYIIFDGANSFQGIGRNFSERRVDNCRFNGKYLENSRGITGIIPADFKLIFFS